MTKDERKMLRELAAASTRVNAWYAHPGQVRGPFCRWFECTQVAPEYRKDVAETTDDCKFAAAAMNNLVPLLDKVDELETEVTRVKSELLKSLKVWRHMVNCGLSFTDETSAIFKELYDLAEKR